MNISRVTLTLVFFLVLCACERAEQSEGAAFDAGQEGSIVIEVDRDGTIFVQGEEVELSTLRDHVARMPRSSFVVELHGEAPTDVVAKINESIGVAVAAQPED